MCWRIFVVLILEDFPGDFPGGFFWALSPTKMRRKNPTRKSAKKSGGSKIKIREKSVLPKAGPRKFTKSDFSGLAPIRRVPTQIRLPDMSFFSLVFLFSWYFCCSGVPWFFQVFSAYFPDLPFLVSFYMPCFSSLQGLPCFFECFSFLSQWFWCSPGKNSPCFFG